MFCFRPSILTLVWKPKDRAYLRASLNVYFTLSITHRHACVREVERGVRGDGISACATAIVSPMSFGKYARLCVPARRLGLCFARFWRRAVPVRTSSSTSHPQGGAPAKPFQCTLPRTSSAALLHLAGDTFSRAKPICWKEPGVLERRCKTEREAVCNCLLKHATRVLVLSCSDSD